MVRILPTWLYLAAREAGKCIVYSGWPCVQSKVLLFLKKTSDIDEYLMMSTTGTLFMKPKH